MSDWSESTIFLLSLNDISIVEAGIFDVRDFVDFVLHSIVFGCHN